MKAEAYHISIIKFFKKNPTVEKPFNTSSEEKRFSSIISTRKAELKRGSNRNRIYLKVKVSSTGSITFKSILSYFFLNLLAAKYFSRLFLSSNVIISSYFVPPASRAIECGCYTAQHEDALIFLFFALLLGAVFTYMISRYFTELHYTVVIFFVGVIIAVIFQQISDSDLFKISVAEWEGFNGELILYIFLPALLFGDLMALNFHRVKENLVSALLLAGPGALFGALLTAVFVKNILPYDWGWALSLLFGSITCATDPVGKLRPSIHSFTLVLTLPIL